MMMCEMCNETAHKIIQECQQMVRRGRLQEKQFSQEIYSGTVTITHVFERLPCALNLSDNVIWLNWWHRHVLLLRRLSPGCSRRTLSWVARANLLHLNRRHRRSLDGARGGSPSCVGFTQVLLLRVRCVGGREDRLTILRDRNNDGQKVLNLKLKLIKSRQKGA